MRALAVICAGLLTCGCSPKRGDPIHFVLPDGYRGPFKIVKGAPGDGYHHDGTRHVYTIPRRGVLRAPLEPFGQFHRSTAEYASGEPIYTMDPGPPPPAPMLWPLGTWNGELWTVVGNEREIERWQQMWNQDGARMLEAELPAESEQPDRSRPMPRKN